MGGTMGFMDSRFRAGVVVVVVLFFIRGAAPVLGNEAPDKVISGGKGTRSPAEAGSPGVAARNAEMVVPARPASENGLKYLAKRQQEDGAFSNSGYGRNAAVVALAGMAWLANGSTPGRGPYGAEVGKVSE